MSDLTDRLRARAEQEAYHAESWGRLIAWSLSGQTALSYGSSAGHHASHALDLREAADLLERRCETCRYSAVAPDKTRWCCVMPDGTSPNAIRAGKIGIANILCFLLKDGCNAWEPRP
jgi:hypothetical protein